MNTLVKSAVTRAYADCNLPWEKGEPLCHLHFRASQSVSREDAIAILKVAIPHGYNHFDADLLAHLPADSKVIIARENSVCLYVMTASKTIDSVPMCADECDKRRVGGHTNTFRLWWD